MKKVAIFTLNGYFNYGNRLQNYALQEVIKDLGFKVETVINTNKFSSQINSNKLNKLKKIKNKSIKELYKLFLNNIERKLNSKIILQRTNVFKEFSNEFIQETNYSIHRDKIPEDLHERYDFFVTGSDQVWNPNYRKGSSIDFLTFAPSEKRIAYAASFGVSRIPEKYVENYSKWLSEIRFLSVREEAGAKIIYELTGRNATVVLDPTMLLTKEKWLTISQTPSHKPIKKYLLTYFLGEIPKSRKKFIKEVAKKNDLDIINLASIRDRIPYVTGPREFIDYINSASLFCTDSFHGAVFSILLERPFIVFSRKENAPSMNSRLETLLKKFELESRYFENISNNQHIFDIDFSHIENILDKERKKSLTFLKKSLRIHNNE